MGSEGSGSVLFEGDVPNKHNSNPLKMTIKIESIKNSDFFERLCPDLTNLYDTLPYKNTKINPKVAIKF